MTAGGTSSSLTETVMALLPADVAKEAQFGRLASFTGELDDLVRVVSGEVRVDQTRLFKLVDDEDIFPPHLGARVKDELHAHLGTRLQTGAKSGESVRWYSLHNHGASIAPAGVQRLHELGFSNATSTEQARALLKEHFPYLPEELLNADGKDLHALAVTALEHNRTVWDCCVAHLGWWGALVAFAVAGAFLIVGTATGPWGIPLAIWLIAVLGGGTAVIVLNCVINPNR